MFDTSNGIENMNFEKLPFEIRFKAEFKLLTQEFYLPEAEDSVTDPICVIAWKMFQIYEKTLLIDKKVSADQQLKLNDYNGKFSNLLTDYLDKKYDVKSTKIES
jgi:hypothetical protein